MSLYSYHIFLFPFQWDKKGSQKLAFSDRYELKNIEISNASMWENLPLPKEKHYEVELFNEKNFFYKFVHNILYDTGKEEFPTIRHYERKEAYQVDLQYLIGVKAGKESIYELKLKSIGLDIFSTGTGVLLFYLENEKYPEFNDIKRINQFGRRVFPPFLGKMNGVEDTKGTELADFIEIRGLLGSPGKYFENFNDYTPNDDWKPARFINSLISDLDPEVEIRPVIDDRMFTMCWCFNNNLATEIKIDYAAFAKSNQWHEYLYVDSGESTCQNDKMQEDLLQEHTYERWQKYGTLYGATRYSLMAISSEEPFPRNIVFPYFRTIYVRIVELVLQQRSSVLKFSEEVTKLSTLPDKDTKKLASNIDKFYKSYIRFVNQVYFREITAQEQGIELYGLMHRNLDMKKQVQDLDDEIGELHNYSSMLEEKAQSGNIGLLTLLGSLFLVPSFLVGFFGMNLLPNFNNDNKIEILAFLLITMALLSLSLFGVVKLNNTRKTLLMSFLIGFIFILISLMLIIPVIYGEVTQK